MKNLKYVLSVALAAGLMVSCASDGAEASETESSGDVIINEAPEPEEDDDSGINFEINTDEDGNVSGGVEGEIGTK